jgi:hypothetical protein
MRPARGTVDRWRLRPQQHVIRRVLTFALIRLVEPLTVSVRVVEEPIADGVGHGGAPIYLCHWAAGAGS